MIRGVGERSDIRKHGADLVKDYHKSLVFNLVRDMGPISRADLARLTTMSATSIGRIVSELIDEDLVFETGQTRAGVGRRATLLDINPNGLLAMGVEIDTHGVSAGIVNLRGELVSPVITVGLDGVGSGGPAAGSAHAAGSDSVRADGGGAGNVRTARMSVDEVLRRAVHVIRQCIACVGEKEASRLLAVGATIPGAVGWPGGEVRFSPQFQWENVPLSKLLEKEISLPTLLENNVKASALAESLFGVMREVTDFAVVTLGSGMGAAIFTEGGLYRGPDNTAGEIGHTLVDPEGPLCDCGRRGCLQVYTCITGIERMAGRPFAEVRRLEREGDAFCAEVMEKARTYLALGFANLACSYNPKFIVVEARFFKWWPTMIQEVEERFNALLWRPIAGSVRIIPSGLREHDAIISGASVVLHEYLTNPVSIRERKLR